MFSRFWSSDARGGKPTDGTDGAACYPAIIASENDTAVAQPAKRRRADSPDSLGTPNDADAMCKRRRLSDRIQEQIDNAGSVMDGLDSPEDKIESAFQLQILIKHEEKRLIDTRIAQCQAALEQLRRCHLKPYPVNCPTPQQMLDVSAGKGHCLQRPGEPVPNFAPPYGVVDGPYSRHYQRWLIPHRDFDGIDYDAYQSADPSRSRASFAEGRTTRNSFGEPSAFSRGRPSRNSIPSAKLQALTSSQAPRKATAGPCVLKRSDGQVVKLVCIDCQRENFSSTQGFINHCRIAHKRDFKSHEEAAVKCGQPYQTPEAAASNGAATPPVEKKQPSASAPAPAPAPVAAPAPAPVPVPASIPAVAAFPRQSGVVNALARSNGPEMSYNEACASLSARLKGVIKLYSQGGDQASKPATAKVETPAVGKKQEPAPETPHLSRLLQRRKFSGNLRELVRDAKTSVSLDDITPDEESDEGGEAPLPGAMPARLPVVKRVPASGGKAPLGHGREQPQEQQRHSSTSSASSSGRSSSNDVEMHEEPSLSPTTLIANNAPSLVSDDGEYDDSDSGSSDSGHPEEEREREQELLSDDVADITMDDDDHTHHRALRRTSTGVSSAVRLRREDPKQVSIVGPVEGKRKL